MLIYPRKISEGKLITRDVSFIMYWIGFLFFLPMLVGIIYGEADWPMYIPLFLFTTGSAKLVQIAFKNNEKPFTRLTIVTLAVTWISFCIAGSFPFIFVDGMSPLDGFFEAVSSISTVGITNIQSLDTSSHSVLFWRAILAWLGGIGITSVAFYGIMQSDSVTKIVLGEGYDRLKPSLINSAREIFKIYSFWTVLGIVLLALIGTPLFDSFNLALNAISTTGVDIHSEGWGYYQRTMPTTFPILAIIVGVLMLVGAIGFVAHYRFLQSKSLKSYFRDSETRAYLVLLGLGTLAIVAYSFATSPQDAFPLAYEGLSISTTGGYEIVPLLTAGASDFIMGMLIFFALIGGCSGSAAGGIKVKRMYIILKYVIWKAARPLAPSGSISHFKYDKKPVFPEEIADVAAYIVVYISAIIVVSLFIVSFGYEAEDSLLLVTSAQAGGGITPIPGWTLEAPIKIALIFTMLFGRLEFLPMFALGMYLFKRGN